MRMVQCVDGDVIVAVQAPDEQFVHRVVSPDELRIDEQVDRVRLAGEQDDAEVEPFCITTSKASP